MSTTDVHSRFDEETEMQRAARVVSAVSKQTSGTPLTAASSMPTVVSVVHSEPIPIHHTESYGDSPEPVTLSARGALESSLQSNEAAVSLTSYSTDLDSPVSARRTWNSLRRQGYMMPTRRRSMSSMRCSSDHIGRQIPDEI